MSETTLTESVLASAKLQASLSTMRRQVVLSEFPALTPTDKEKSLDWNFTLLCASALTTEPSEAGQEVALRIATGCIISKDTNDVQKAAAAGLLERLGNRRTLDLAERRDLVEEHIWTGLPAAFRLDVMRRRMELTVNRTDGTDLPVNAFQSEFWEAASTNRWVSVSAPTSAGKSRIIREWFTEQLRTNAKFTAVYLVPTRALVEEVAEDFRQLKLQSMGVFTLPWDQSLGTHTKNVFVLTQERLHLLQHTQARFKADLLFVDEAQNLGEASRGVLLQHVIDQTVHDNPAVQVLFASPLTSNPELLLSTATEGSKIAFTSETVTVSQNLIHVRSVRGKPLLREFWLVQNGVPKLIATFALPHRATHIPKRLAFVSLALGGDESGNLVYVNGASEAENVAKSLYESLSVVDNPEHLEDIANLQELVKAAIHPKYALVDCLERGVAFHYGNMPLAVKTEVERLFHTGAIRYLVCTSTLLEGVNLPCRNIFMRNPKKGSGNPLTAADFWNLAGRAGRWGTEFQGNIVCIDTDDETIWENLPTVRKRAPLHRSVDKALIKAESVIDQATAASPGGEDDSRAESTFSYLCARKVDGRNIEALLSGIESEDLRGDLRRSLDATIDSLQFPLDLVARHAGISPVAMQRLFTHFRNSDREVLDFALPVPEDASARASYQRAFEILSETVTTAFGTTRRQWQLANLSVNWMSGMPLARLIDQRLSNSAKALPAVIRDVMSDVEKVARFQAPKYLACYLDLLRVHAQDLGEENLGELPDITMMLELGVSRVTEVSMMALGLSRPATIAMSGFINDDAMTPSEVLTWLQSQNFDGLNLPVLVRREVQARIQEQSMLEAQDPM